MKPALIFFSILSGLTLLFAQDWPAQRTCSGKALPITLLPGPKYTSPSLPLRFGGTRLWPGPPINGFKTETDFRLVIKSQDEFKQFWERFTAQMPPDNKAPLPEIDFSKEMIVVAAMGFRSTSGPYVIFIDGACEADGRIEVFVSNRDDPCGGGWTVPSYPADAVRIPKSELPVVFRETQISCAAWKKYYRLE